MKKIRLNLDCIEVESFQTASIPGETGTVEAHFRSRPGDTFCGADCYSVANPCPTDVACGNTDWC
jgi:hypothetical protein